MKFVTTLARAGTLALVTAALGGCSMGPLFGNSQSQAASNANLANAVPSPAQIAQAQSNALPAIATECPPIKVRPGGEAMFYYGNARVGDATKLNYQVVISDTSRNCVVSNGLITVNMGAVGRVLLGPAGKQSSINVPLRFAVERQGQAVYSEKFSIPVTITPPAESADFSKVVNGVQVPYLQGDDITIWVGFDPHG